MNTLEEFSIADKPIDMFLDGMKLENMEEPKAQEWNRTFSLFNKCSYKIKAIS